MLNVTKSVADIAIAVEDISRSLSFYVEILGFEPAGQIQIPESDAIRGQQASTGFTVHMLKFGNQLVKLVELKKLAPRPGGMIDAALGYRYITVGVKSVKEEYKNLRRLGVNFLSEPLTPRAGLSLVFLADPDGNYIELIGGE